MIRWKYCAFGGICVGIPCIKYTVNKVEIQYRDIAFLWINLSFWNIMLTETDTYDTIFTQAVCVESGGEEMAEHNKSVSSVKNNHLIEIMDFLTNFKALTGAHMGIHDLQYSIAISSGLPEENLCAICKKYSNRFLRKCICDDKYYLDQAIRTQQITTFRCHLGLTSVIIPIVEGGVVNGVVDFGMILVLPDKYLEFDTLFKRLSQEYPESFDEDDREDMLNAYNHSPSMTEEELCHYTSLVKYGARGLYLNRLFTGDVPSPEERLRIHMMFLHPECCPLSSFSVVDVAGQLSVSCSHLNRISHAVYGMSLKQYVLQKKIQYAADLIHSRPTLSVKEISKAVGIEDQLYFSRLFTRIMKCSCSEFRQNFQENME